MRAATYLTRSCAAAGGAGEAAGGLRCAVLFMVNRSDCGAFRPCHEADPLFAQVLRAAHEAGKRLHWREPGRICSQCHNAAGGRGWK